MVEISPSSAEHPSIFIARSLESHPEKLMLLVLRWFLSTLKQQHSPVDENGKKKKLKPLNPFLGEIFQGRWCDDAGETKLVAEQVSHHPPATAYNVWNDRYGVRVCPTRSAKFAQGLTVVQLRGHVAPKVYFSGTVHIDRKGYSILHLDRYDEDYLITMPKVHVEGLMTASLQPELSGSSFIRSSFGYTAKIDYSCKGWLSGKRNSFAASMYKDGCEKTPLYTAEGLWSDVFTFKNVRTGEVVEKFDCKAHPTTPLQVAPIQEQHPLESRRAWQPVVEAINRGDIFTIAKEKTKIENEQRALRRQEKCEGVEFRRRYFSPAKEDIVAEKLAEGLQEKTSMKGNLDGAHGIWMWDEEKCQMLQASECTKMPTRTKFQSIDSGVAGIKLDRLEIS